MEVEKGVTGKDIVFGKKEEYIKSRDEIREEEQQVQNSDAVASGIDEADEKISLTDKIKSILSRMFEIEDQRIN